MNPTRLHGEAAFAAVCGASPVEASSGKTIRHRLNRGGGRAANSGGRSPTTASCMTRAAAPTEVPPLLRRPGHLAPAGVAASRLR
jgi:Transposase IS116/IS110/IS902 family